MTDINQAEEILKKIKIDNYTYLGKGDEGIVFHDNLYVYKVFINNTLDKKSSDFLKKLISKPLISNFFINLLDLVLVDDIYVLKYSYYN